MRSSTPIPFLFAASIVASPIVNTVIDEIVQTAVVNEVVTVHKGANQPAPTLVSSVVVELDAVQAQTPGNTATSAVPVASETSAPSTSGLPLTYQHDLDTESATYQGLVLLNHNVHRANHSVPDLVYNNTLASYAEQIAKTCVYNHSMAAGDGDYGQNIGAGFDAGQISTLVTNFFYNNELGNYPLPYGQENPAGFESWGHFSQMVWSDTTSVGCYTYDCSPPGQRATQDCDANGQSYLKNQPCSSNPRIAGTAAVFTVCNYYPKGNIDGHFDAVKAPLGHGVVQMTDSGLKGV